MTGGLGRWRFEVCLRVPNCTRWGLLTLLLFTTFGCASRRVIPGQWEGFTTTPPGTEIDVLPRAGPAVQGVYQTSTEDEVTLIDQAGSEITIQRREIQEITMANADSLTNGALIGLAVGAGGGAVTQVEGGREAFWSTFGWSVGLGVLLDWIWKDYAVLYRSP